MVIYDDDDEDDEDDWQPTIQTTARVAVVADKERCGARGRIIDMYLID